jgi:hypothetical protein
MERLRTAEEPPWKMVYEAVKAVPPRQPYVNEVV